MKYKEWLNDWLELYVKPTVKVRTYEKYHIMVQKHIAPALGEYELEKLTADVLQRFIVKLSETLSTSYINSVITVLRKSLNMAVILGISGAQFADKIVRPKTQEKKIECFTVTEQRKIEQAIFSSKKQRLFGIVLSYSNNSNIDAGTYTVTASFTGDNENYESISDMTATLTIQKANYDMSNVTFADGNYTYDGTAKTLEISGTLPDGVTVSYSNNSNIDAGTYFVTASFIGDSANYEAISDMTATLTIKKATLSVTMDNSNYTYSGSYYNLAINETLPDGVSVYYNNNNQINAGTYTVMAIITVNSNYYEVADVTAVLTINKAEVTITAEDKTSV